MSASADVLALANAEFDIGAIPVGQGITVKWRGKPIFIRHRTSAEIEKEAAVSMAELRDAEPDSSRVQKPEWYVTSRTREQGLGQCTSLHSPQPTLHALWRVEVLPFS